MVCYIVPTVAALITYAQRKMSKNEDEKLLWLNLLLAGGAIFGLIDHWWNGELTFIGPNIFRDLALGVLITATIYAVWYVMVLTVPTAKAARR